MEMELAEASSSGSGPNQENMEKSMETQGT